MLCNPFKIKNLVVHISSFTITLTLKPCKYISTVSVNEPEPTAACLCHVHVCVFGCLCVSRVAACAFFICLSPFAEELKSGLGRNFISSDQSGSS